MIPFTKKQIIIFIIILCIVVMTIFFYLWKQNQEIANTEIDLIGNILENETGNQVQTEDTKEKDTFIYVHITGQVKKEGIIKLSLGSRLVDAIEAANGTTQEADLSQVNLAYVLEDAQKIYIPSKSDKEIEEIPEYLTTDPGQSVISEDTSSKASPKININTASQTELEMIPGVGPSTALSIISYRKENGSFSKIEEIQNVKGIGEAKFNSMKDSICIK